MWISPPWLSFILAVVVSTLTTVFLNFLPDTNATTLFVGGISSFLSSLLLFYYAIDLLVFREVNQIYKAVKKLKSKDFDLSKSSLLRNVNPLKKLNREITNYVSRKQEEIEELKRMEQFRREFIADVSHELKTPIFAAQGFVHTLLDGAIDDPAVSTRFLNKAAKSLDALNALVSDLLTLSQVESGDLKMHLEVVDLQQLTLDIFDQLEKKAEKRHIKLKLKSKSMQGCFVMADEQRIRQVMTNFVDNAIKYGREHGKAIVEFEEDKKYMQISVQDDGPGIPPEHLGRIFERFYRVDKSRNRETGGTGLGLAIVKHILNAHNSNVSVTSKVDKGTRFTFRLVKAEE